MKRGEGSQGSPGEVLVIRTEAWRHRGGVAWAPRMACRAAAHGSRRCYAAEMKESLVIPKDNAKSEDDDCRKYNWKND